MRQALALAAAAAALAAACGGSDAEPGPASTGEPTTIPAPRAAGAEAERGRTVIGQSGCIACHRIADDVGNDGPGPDLRVSGGALTPERIREVIVDGGGTMPAFRDLPAEDVDAMVAYVVALGG
jgi:mono/diheme cytochrome c family protein